MAFTALCPAPGWTVRLPDEQQDKEAACPECGKQFVIEPASTSGRVFWWYPRQLRFLVRLPPQLAFCSSVVKPTGSAIP